MPTAEPSPAPGSRHNWCLAARTLFAEAPREALVALVRGADLVELENGELVIKQGGRVNLDELAARLAAHGTFKVMGRMLVRGRLDAEISPEGPPLELTVFADGRAIVKGTTRADVARSVYARYVGN